MKFAKFFSLENNRLYGISLLQQVGFTGEDPTNSTLTECEYLTWQWKHKQLLRASSSVLYYNDEKLYELGTGDVKPCQSLGLLLTREGECHWFLDDKWRGSVHLRDFPLNQPMWGVVDVYGQCQQVRAGTCTGKSPPHSVSSCYNATRHVVPKIKKVDFYHTKKAAAVTKASFSKFTILLF